MFPFVIESAALSPSLATWIATFGHVGFARKAPGTFGSLAALPIGYLILWAGGIWALLAATIVVFFVGWKAADAYEAHTGKHDPSEIVIDEVAGQWLGIISMCITLSHLVGYITAKMPIYNPTIIDSLYVAFAYPEIWQPTMLYDPTDKLLGIAVIVCWLVAFALFRFYDILKPWPIGWVDRNMQGGLGTMVDDVLASVMVGVTGIAGIEIMMLM